MLREKWTKILTVAVLAMAVVGLAGATAYYQHQSSKMLVALQVNASAQKAQAAANGAEKNKPILIFDYCIAEGNEIDDLALTRIRASILEIGANSKPDDESYEVAKKWLEETIVPIDAVKWDANPDVAESIKTCNSYRSNGSILFQPGTSISRPPATIECYRAARATGRSISSSGGSAQVREKSSMDGLGHWVANKASM